jgi:hypothetical protein
LGAARNNLGAERQVRVMGRGGVLDKHMGETGLSVTIGVDDPDRDLLQLSAINRTNPERLTVGIDVSEVSAAGPGADQRVQIVLSWGTGKGVSSAIVDARHGAQITLVANVLNVAVRYLGTAGPRMRVGASAGYGARPGGNAALTFTEAATVPLGAGLMSAAFRIPKWATRASWVSPDDPLLFVPPAATMRFFTDPAVDVQAVSAAATTMVAIPNGADFMVLRNDAGPGRVYRLIYELGL